MKLFRVMTMIALVFAVAGCGGASTNAPGDSSAVVEALLKDGSIELDPTTAVAGPVTFEVTNQGAVVHEVEVFSGSVTELPVDLGVADTSGLASLGGVKDIESGAIASLDLDLTPGDYVIICNLPGHYQLGMITTLRVTG